MYTCVMQEGNSGLEFGSECGDIVGNKLLNRVTERYLQGLRGNVRLQIKVSLNGQHITHGVAHLRLQHLVS